MKMDKEKIEVAIKHIEEVVETMRELEKWAKGKDWKEVEPLFPKIQIVHDGMRELDKILLAIRKERKR